MTHEPQALNEHDFESAGKLLAEAFFDNPAHVYMFPNEQHREHNLAWLLERNLLQQAPLENSFCLLEQDELSSRRTVIAMGFWHRPGKTGVSVGSLLRSGIWRLPVRCGISTTRRLFESVAGIEQASDDALGSRNAWFLNNMVIAKQMQGKGVGSQLLERELRERIDPAGEMAALATQKPENVTFYQRLGFEVANERTLGSGPNAFRNWIMTREPAR